VKVLERYTETPSPDECKMALSEHNKVKNRFSTVHLLSRDADLPVLAGALAVSDYINAVYVDSYSQRNKFIVTQTPLVNTVDDFWAMICDHRVRLAVSTSHSKNRPELSRTRPKPQLFSMSSSKTN